MPRYLISLSLLTFLSLIFLLFKRMNHKTWTEIKFKLITLNLLTQFIKKKCFQFFFSFLNLILRRRRRRKNRRINLKSIFRSSHPLTQSQVWQGDFIEELLISENPLNGVKFSNFYSDQHFTFPHSINVARSPEYKILFINN